MNFFINEFKTKFGQKTTTLEFKDAKEVVDYFKEMGIQQIKGKENIPLALFGKLYDGKTSRKQADLESTNFVVLDIDQTSSEEITAALEKLSTFYYVAHETFSSTVELPRWRIIVPIDEVVTSNQFKNEKLAIRLAQMLGLSSIDPVSSKPVQPYYLPSAPEGVNRELIAHEGEKCFSITLLPDIQSSSEVETVSTSRSSKGMGDSECMEEAQRLIDDVFDGNVMYTENCFHLYSESGIWTAYTPDIMLQYLVVDVYQKVKPLSDVTSILKVLKVLALKPEFPKCNNDENVLVFDNCAVSPVTGEKLEHSAKHHARHKLSFQYDENAECPQWTAF